MSQRPSLTAAMPPVEPVGLYVKLMSLFSFTNDSPNAPMTFSIEVDPSVETEPDVVAFPQPVSTMSATAAIITMHLNPELDVEGVVLTMFDSRTNLSSQVVTEVKKFFKNKVYNTIIPRSVRLSEAPSFGLPISLYDPKSTGAKAYGELAREIVGKDD